MNCIKDCPICNGDGYLRLDVPVGHPFFGRLITCPNLPDLYKASLKRSGLYPEEFNLDPNDMLEVNEVENVRTTIHEVVKRGYGLVYLWGDFGTGKTTYLKSIVASYNRGDYVVREADPKSLYDRLMNPTEADVRQFLHGQGSAVYLKSSRLIDTVMKSQFHPDRDNEARDIEFWTMSKLLVLDEFDKVRETPFAQEKRFDFLDERYEQACLKRSVTILAGNSNPDEVFEGYIVDRLRDKRTLVIWSGEKSYRPVAEW